MSPAQEEALARTRLRSLSKARTARRRQLERERCLQVRRWSAWLRWCRESGEAFHELRLARAAEDPERIGRAKRRDLAVLRRMPAMPKGPRP